MENDKLVRPRDAIRAILDEKILGFRLEIMHLTGVGLQAETLNQACDRHAQYIRDLPAVDVVEVVHGEWKDTGSGQVCSECGEFQPGYDNFRFYCPRCGARMDGGK